MKTPPPQITVARAVQRLAGRAVRRAALPLGGLLVAGVVQGVGSGFSGARLLLMGGALASGLVMLIYGVQSVRRVLGRPAGAWGPIFWVGSWIPYLYGMYVLFGVGLRPFISPGVDASSGDLLAAPLYAILGGMVIRAQWKLSEVHSLSQEMTGFVAGTEV